MKKSDLVLGIITVILGIIIIVSTGEMNATIAAFPKISAYLLIIIGTLLILNFANALRKNNLVTKKTEKTDISSYFKVVSIVAMFIAYMYVLEVLGFIIPTCILMLGVIYLAGYKNLKVNIITSVCITLGLFLIFKFLFQVQFPKGLFF